MKTKHLRDYMTPEQLADNGRGVIDMTSAFQRAIDDSSWEIEDKYIFQLPTVEPNPIINMRPIKLVSTYLVVVETQDIIAAAKPNS